ncbi:E3 ubiquitin-protein ligase CHFR [Protopterus annectens]|uniref:E3 ubiquitin-protein ligase CHFR n=1 Tax=Protopterus annectens TaxID=7888 RepID=UPI001CFA17F6|nr:E3 ubiquitin-protein ligase CHFR [Protopterus annectens]
MEPTAEKPKAWGKLTLIGGACIESKIFLVNREWTVGRKNGCDLSLPSNKLVSGNHCKIIADQTSGQVWLEDTSTNGTVINKSKVVKKQTYPLQSGDVIYIVYRKNEPENNVAFLYESLSTADGIAVKEVPADGGTPCCKAGNTSSVEKSVDADLAQEGSLVPFPEESESWASDLDLYNSASPPARQSVSEVDDSELASTSLSFPGTVCPQESLKTGIPAAVSGADEPQKLHSPVLTSLDNEGTEGTVLPSSVQQDEEEAIINLGPARKKRRGGSSCFDCNLSEHGTAEKKLKETLTDEVKVMMTKPDKMEETLTCIICQELLHDCVSLQPCMHTFCAACYSGWMERSSLCPTCRCPVDRISKNHMLNNLAEAYLLQHPDKGRSREELLTMDAQNKITQDMLQPKIKRSFSDEEGSSEELLELSDADSESSDISQPYIICRQCPGYWRNHNHPVLYPVPETQAAGFVIPGDTPSTSANVPAAAQEYVCLPHGNHVVCSCCFQPMPDRRDDPGHCPNITPQYCTACLQPFCHMYWGCTRIGCFGCLAHFRDLNFTEKCLDGILNNNMYESDILKNYLASRGLTWKDMLNDCVTSLQRGVFKLSDYRIAAHSVLCYSCGLRNFRELAYQYRQNIPAPELPVAVTARPDCYWGRNCRTQVKAHHAMKFNHICEQTRFKN